LPPVQWDRLDYLFTKGMNSSLHHSGPVPSHSPE
jgi:hypothetical protein